MKYSAILIATAVAFFSTCAMADPENAYKGGKAFRDTITGTKPKVDDRDFEQKARDYARQKGCEHGGGSNCARKYNNGSAR